MTTTSDTADTDETTVTTVQQAMERPVSDRLFLLILQEGHFITQPLPANGDLIIGRSERCDVRIQDPSISRQHAMLHIGDRLTVEDVGSVNGTEVRDVRLEPNKAVEVSTNEVFVIGQVSVVVQQRPSPVRSRRLWSHDYFEGRVAEECARAERSGSTFTVVRLRFDMDVTTDQLQQPLNDILREVDVVGVYGPGEYEVLLVDAALDEAELVTGRLKTRLDEAGVPVAIGVASYPKHGRVGDKLLARASKSARQQEDEPIEDSSVVLVDDSMRNLYQLAERIAQGNINVLILGETGAGKQVLAEAIHKKSKRSDKPFLELNCSAFSETLLESELFGHEKGAFTGATQSKSGLLETADGGTVFLDEIGDMALPLQAKLLRVIENQEVLRVGGLKPRKINVRFVAATNRELENEVVRGTFRQDLFFRINGVTLQLPPLRQRKSEIAHLARVFVNDFCKQDGRSNTLSVSDEALEMLRAYSWPGNIRELRNVMERATLLCLGNIITPEHLPVEKMATTFATPVQAPAGRGWPLPTAAELDSQKSRVDEGGRRGKKDETEDEKRQRILAALMECGGNNTEAAKILGVSRRTLGKWLEAHNIPRPRKKKSD